MKGNDMMKLPELKKIVRSQDIRYPGMLTMKKADLIRNMKKRGMWESGKAKGGPKSMRKKPAKKPAKGKKSKLDKGQKEFLAGIY
tara:strand:+ start:279 stop:533 length:255 start_codon:yes stop_codon:yes gene_type:complete